MIIFRKKINMRTIQLLFVVLLLSLQYSCISNKNFFSRKYLGNYHGTQEEYQVHIDGKDIYFPSEEYDLTLYYGKLRMNSSRQSLNGNYTVSSRTKKVITLNVRLENGITEEWQIITGSKKIVRNTIAPQTNVVFTLVSRAKF